jgi:DNA-directed RNA polymerase subunit beta'
MANTSGRTIEIPIKANFREGLNVLEYFISSRGARKGLADTALRTADSGYLTRRLVDVSQDVIVREDDCGTTDGIWVSDIKDGNEMIEPMRDRLVGRFTCSDVIDPKTGEVIVAGEQMIGDAAAEKIVKAGITKSRSEACWSAAPNTASAPSATGPTWPTGSRVSAGEAVGIIAAQSIGEPAPSSPCVPSTPAASPETTSPRDFPAWRSSSRRENPSIWPFWPRSRGRFPSAR